MNPTVLARLFRAQADALDDGGGGLAQMPQEGQGNNPPPLEAEPDQDLWGQEPPPNQGPFMAPDRRRAMDDGYLPPSDYKYLDRVEGDDAPLGVMFGQEAGEPVGDGENVPMSQLPDYAAEGQYISPLDMAPASKRMSTKRP